MKNNIISELETALKQKLNNGLLSVIIFGSIVKGNFTSTSDIDVLVICEAPPKDWRARDKMALELTENIEIKYGTPIHITLVSKDEITYAIESVSPLILEIYNAKKIGKGIWKIPSLAVIEGG